VPETVSVDVTLRVYEDRETEGVCPSSARTVGGASAVETSGGPGRGLGLTAPGAACLPRYCKMCGDTSVNKFNIHHLEL
jgi:hypothetical protein